MTHADRQHDTGAPAWRHPLPDDDPAAQIRAWLRRRAEAYIAGSDPRLAAIAVETLRALAAREARA